MRLFVAVNLPDAEKRRLQGVLGELKQSALPLRWVEPEAVHITLKFLGEVAEAKCEGVLTALRASVLGLSSFDVEIGGFGAFPSLARPHIFWMGVAASMPLRRAQSRVEQEFAAIGFPPEDRPFHPHLTIGRMKNASVSVGRAELDRITSSVVYKAVVAVESIDLMRSHAGPRGARYERVECAMLEQNR